MHCLLHIDASARVDRSISRDLSSKFVATWKEVRPDDDIVRRDLATDAPSFVCQDWIDACFTPEADRTKMQTDILRESDKLIDELERADVVVLGTPMYNYGLPASLKAWVDQVVRIDKTFSFDLARGDYPLEPILSGKTMICLIAKGEFGFDRGGIREKMNHLDPHVETLSHYFGVKEIHSISVEYQEFDDERHRRSRESAVQNTVALAQTLARDIVLSEKSHNARIEIADAERT